MSKMDSHRDVREYESSAKRMKYDVCENNISELRDIKDTSSSSSSNVKQIDIPEGISTNCDSGYEAETSTMESSNKSPHHTFNTESSDVQEGTSSESSLPAPSTDQQDTSQDCLEVDDDNASTVSELSGLTDLSGQDWKPMNGSMTWIQQQMNKGVNPRELLTELGMDNEQIPDYVDDVTIWKIILSILGEPPRRNKLRHVNTLDDVVRLLKGAQNIIVLTGAGVSVSCGIPDFRSRGGIYSRLAIDFPNLPDPQAMFDINFFNLDPRPFFKFARDIYPGKFQPSPCHRFIKLLEKNKKLLRNYTQNIDTLEKIANIDKVIECHGSFATATCTKCGYQVTNEEIRDIVLSQKIPLCTLCHPSGSLSASTDDLRINHENMDYRQLVASGIMKPDIVFFGEGLSDRFHEAMADDKSKCDLLLVIGSSLKVRPVALIPHSLLPNVPQILINREPLSHCHFDVELMGDCDVIINHLCQLLEWDEGVYSSQKLELSPTLLPFEDSCPFEPERELSSESAPETSNWPQISSSMDNVHCECSNSTKCSSLEREKDSESLCCKCNLKFTKSITNNEGECGDKSDRVKVRHISVDSTRDSGIGDNSNFTDKCDDYLDDDVEKGNFHFELSKKSSERYFKDGQNERFSNMKGFWQPKLRKSLAERLPENSYHLIPPSRYIFPGAEVYHDPDEKLHYENESSSSDSSDFGSDSESNTVNV